MSSHVPTARKAPVMAFCLFAFMLGIATAPAAQSAKKQKAGPPLPDITAFQAGESLTYDVNWSNVVKAGTAVMEVRGERSADGREVLRLVVTSRTVGAVKKFYPLGNTVESVFDPKLLASLSYHLTERRGKRTRRLEVGFDHARRTAVSRRNEDPPKTLAMPDPVQDPLSALYYLRTRRDFRAGEPVTFTVFGGSESVAVEVQTLGRERVKTPAGEFSAIKLKAYKGLFMSEGEIYIWLTDDARKIPALIESKLAVGSLVFTLRSVKPPVP